jgi:NAD-dependent deacetylase sirtuin 2
MDIKILNIIDKIKNCEISNIVILSGSGISTITGIPDFRSPGGLYQTLKPELLTCTEKERKLLKKDSVYVVHYDMFKNNPFPYLEVRRPFILGTHEKKWKPSIAHFFFKLLQEKNLLRRLYTQNIDGLDQQTGLPEDYIINVHGSLTKISCEFCKETYPYDKFISYVKNNVRNIYDPNDNTTSSKLFCSCCGLAGIKPNTVMYGRQLPGSVFEHVDEDFFKADLLIIVGTSLTVHPACDFINKVRPSVPRLLVNNQYVGEDLGMNFCNKSRDSALIGEIDNEFLRLINYLDWTDDLNKYRDIMCENSSNLL